MAKCCKCGKRGLFLKLDFKGCCESCALDSQQKLFKSISLPKQKPSLQTVVPSSTSHSDVNSTKNILVYDLTSTQINKVFDIIRKLPGVLQKDLCKSFDPEYRPAIRELLYHMTSQSLIRRSKESNTYRLYLCGNYTAMHFKMPPRPKVKTPEQRFKEGTEWQKKQLALYKKEGTRKVVWDCGRLNGRECPECLAKNGKVYWIDRPPKCPAHVGCTCILSAVVEIGNENVPVTGE